MKKLIQLVLSAVLALGCSPGIVTYAYADDLASQNTSPTPSPAPTPPAPKPKPKPKPKTGFVKKANGKRYYLKKGVVQKNKKLWIKERRYKFNASGASKIIAVKLKVPMIKQRPELPTGCEVVSLAQVLKYKGVKISKTKLAKQMKRHPSNPNKGFVGNPRNWSGSTIFPPALKPLMKKHAGSAKDMTGASFKRVRKQLRAKKPIIFWVGGMHGFGVHAIVITGYDGKGNYYYNDCWSGKKAKKISQKKLAKYWNRLGRRALSY